MHGSSEQSDSKPGLASPVMHSVPRVPDPMAITANHTITYPKETLNRNHIKNRFQSGFKRLSYLLGLMNQRRAFHPVVCEYICLRHCCQ